MKRRLTLLPLIAATYFIVAGGPFGLEDTVSRAGYIGAISILLITPLIWSLPTALMVSELASAIPEEGGYYEWVRRAMGPFWGFQEAWLSLVASIFDMAIYPTLFVLYLGQLVPAAALWNIGGVGAVGDGSSLMMFALLAPFGALTIYSVFLNHGWPTLAGVA